MSVSKRTKFTRTRRLQSAKAWLSIYNGKNLVRGYTNHYKTDLICAIAELRMLGVPVTTEREESIKQSIKVRAEHRRKKKEAARYDNSLMDDQDENFAFIVGYTSGGAPYGTRWDEMTEYTGAETDDFE